MFENVIYSQYRENDVQYSEFERKSRLVWVLWMRLHNLDLYDTPDDTHANDVFILLFAVDRSFEPNLMLQQIKAQLINANNLSLSYWLSEIVDLYHGNNNRIHKKTVFSRFFHFETMNSIIANTKTTI